MQLRPSLSSSLTRIMYAIGLIMIPLKAPCQSVFVSSYYQGTVISISPDGTQSIFCSGLSTPEGIAFDSSGNLYVAQIGAANGNYGSIVKIGPGGVQSTFASGLNSAVALAFDSAGNLFVDSVSGGTISKITPDGRQTVFASGLSSLEGMAVDNAGNLFVVSYGYGSIYKFTPGGVRTIFASGLQSPYGIAIDQQNNVFEADDASSSINKFTPSGTKSTVGSNLRNVYNCMAVDGAGNLLVGQWGTGIGYDGSIVKLTPGGVQSMFASGLYSPTAMALPTPEPSSFRLLSAAIAVLVSCACHRNFLNSTVKALEKRAKGRH